MHILLAAQQALAATPAGAAASTPGRTTSQAYKSRSRSADRAISLADAETGMAVLKALCRERADSGAAAWALKALPREQDFYAMLLQHYRARGSRKVRVANVPCVD